MPVNGDTNRPGLAMVANCMTPYRAHLHALIAEGIPELKLHTLITHGAAEFSWEMDVPDSIHPSFFNYRNDSALASVFKSPHREWRKGGKLIEFLHDNRIKAVICAGYQYLSYLRLINHCHNSGIPLFAHNDSNIRSERLLSSWKRFFKRRLYHLWLPKVVGAMPMGELGEQFYLSYGVPRDRLYRLPCTPDYELFASVAPRALQAFQTKFGLSADRRYLLYCGRLTEVKRVDLLIDAFAQISSVRSEWDLLIAGDGKLKLELTRRLPEMLLRRVIWTGFLESSELVAAYHSAETLVLPSDFEPWALVVQEAMAAGLAIIASDVVGAAYDLIQDRKSGRIFVAGSLTELTDAILDVTDPDNLESYQNNARLALAQWRRQVDPVAEVRRALVDAGVLPTPGIASKSTDGSDSSTAVN